MRRPAAQAKTLERIRAWRAICPDLTIRSTFIVGFPGETDDEFQTLLDWLDEAELDRVGCFRYEPVAGAAANGVAPPVPDAVKDERWHRLMRRQQAISAKRLKRKVGRRHRRHHRRGRAGDRQGPQQGRCARDRRRGPRRQPPSAPPRRDRDREDRARRRLRPARHGGGVLIQKV